MIRNHAGAVAWVAWGCRPVLLLGLLLQVAGCTRAPAKPVTRRPPLAPHEIRIWPASLFNNSTRLLEPHLRLRTGAVRIEYPGPGKCLHYGYEIWEKGKVTSPLRAGSSSISVPFSGWLTVSLADSAEGVAPPQYEGVVALHTEAPGSSGSAVVMAYRVPQPSVALKIGRLRPLDGPVTLTDGQEIAFWGYMVGKGATGYQGDETIIDVAKRAEWALVLKLRVGMKPPSP
ncbi:MAG: hypothetical protein ACYS9X_18100 [Planctomycetota bacterium]|jgi:hypothetical protein